MSRFLMILVACAIAGCQSPVEGPRTSDPLLSGEPVDGIRLLLTESSYRSPATAVVTLANESNASVGYNPCFAERESWTGSSWQRFQFLRLCTMQEFRLGPGERVTFPEVISDEWQPGKHRIILIVYPSSGDPVTVATPDFTVIE